jgi:hypothetical protein
MPPESVSRPETTTLIVKLARFAILCTLALMGVLLIFHLLTNGRLGLLTESVVQSSLYVIGIEVIAAIAAATCLALWKKSE